MHAARLQVGGIFFSIQRIVQQVCASGVPAAGCATACLRASSAPERCVACMRTELTGKNFVRVRQHARRPAPCATCAAC